MIETIFARMATLVDAIMRSLGQEWTFVQLAAAAAAIIAALIASKWVEPWLERRVRRVKNWPRMLRALVVILHRTRWLLASASMWLALAMFRAFTGARGDALGVTAALVTAWAVISVASRLIRNRTVSKAVAVMGWLIVALALLGLLEATADALDVYAISLGATRISALTLIKAAAWLGVLLWIAGLFGSFVDRWLKRTPDITPSFQVLIGKLVKVLLFALAAVVTVAAVGVDITALAVFSGAIGLGLGFGLQKIVSNLFAGIIILADKSIKPGDVIQIGDTVGRIRNLRARFASAITRDGREFLIPNEDLITEKVVNWTYSDALVRLEVTFGVSYDSDPHAVGELAKTAASKVARVCETPRPVCILKAFGESSLDFGLRFWIVDPANGLSNVRGEVLLACWDAFKANGVEIPYPRRDVVLRR